MEFEVVRIAEDILYRPAIDRRDEARAFTQSRAEQRMVQVSLCFVARCDRILLRHSAASESFDLWKNEPHPMALLAARTQFARGLIVDAALGVDEALQVVGIAGSGHRSVPPARAG